MREAAVIGLVQIAQFNNDVDESRYSRGHKAKRKQLLSYIKLKKFQFF